MEVKQSLDELLESFKSQFATDETSIGMINLTKMQIDPGSSDPVSQKPYSIATKHYDWVKDEINKLLDVKVICNSHSSWSAPIIMVPKGNGGMCLVINYKVTQKCTCPMPKVEDIFSKLHGVKLHLTSEI